MTRLFNTTVTHSLTVVVSTPQTVDSSTRWGCHMFALLIATPNRDMASVGIAAPLPWQRLIFDNKRSISNPCHPSADSDCESVTWFSVVGVVNKCITINQIYCNIRVEWKWKHFSSCMSVPSVINKRVVIRVKVRKAAGKLTGVCEGKVCNIDEF